MVGFLETCSSVRRGEGGGERRGGPLWSPAVPFHLVPFPLGLTGSFPEPSNKNEREEE